LGNNGSKIENSLSVAGSPEVVSVKVLLVVNALFRRPGVSGRLFPRQKGIGIPLEQSNDLGGNPASYFAQSVGIM
jgi:hypothetical protein